MSIAVYVQCTKCNLGFQVSKADKDLSLLGIQARLPCVKDGCKGRLKQVNALKVDTSKFRSIKAYDLFAALGGGGLPEERKRCTPDQLKTLMLRKKVTEVTLEASVGSTRSFIKSITFEGGSKVHFGGSTKGATIFKVTEVSNVRR